MKKFLSVLLSLMMLVSVVPTTAFAAEADDVTEDSTTTESGIKLSKKAELEDDGTYTITLEAYVEGQVDQISKPADIVLVLDQSASMYTPMGADGYRTSTDYFGDDTDNNLKKYTPEELGVDAADGGVKKGYYVAQSKTVEDEKYYYWYVVDYDENNTEKPWTLYRVYYTSKPAECGKIIDTDSWNFDNAPATKSCSTEELENYDIYKTQYGELYDSIKDFAEKLIESGIKHRLAIVGFSSNNYEANEDGFSAGSGIYDAGEFKLYSEYTDDEGTIQSQILEKTENGYEEVDDVDSVYENAFADVTTDADGIRASIEAVTTNYIHTHHEIGLRIAKNILKKTTVNDSNSGDGSVGRERFVVFFTDGIPSSSDTKVKPVDDIKNEAVAEAAEIKELGATVYSIYTANVTEKFVDYISSDYPDADVTTDEDGNSGIVSGDMASDEAVYSKSISNAGDMGTIFNSIFTAVGNSSVELGTNTVLKDIISDEFTLPAGYDAATNISVATCAYAGNGEWEAAVDANESVTVTVANNTVDVTGFDYAENFVLDAIEETGAAVRGAKLVVTIKGVVATDNAAIGEPIYTNKAESGLYSAGVLLKEFDRPYTTITNKNYVLDFGKPVEVNSSDWKMVSIVSGNDASDGIMNGITASVEEFKMEYGKFELAKPGVDIETNEPTGTYSALMYTPQTMNWSGYDSIYLLGKTTDDEIVGASTESSANVTGNLWAKVSFIPATSVYYEDSFVTNDETGVTGITYYGDWKVEGSTENAAASQSSANIVYGTDAAYADDLTYSDGSAHVVQIDKNTTSAPTLSFTFTGTGIDIYTRTTATSGQVMVTAKGQQNGETYFAWIDNEFKQTDDSSINDAGLYQIPTVSFQDMVRDTYDVTIRITSDSEGNSTYYLDAIRIYNPIDETTDTTVEKAYEEAEENNALTAEVRDFIIDPENAQIATDGKEIEGAVYIDDLNGSQELWNEDDTINTDAIDTYKDLGPMNEVYLAPGQKVAFEITTPYQGKALLGVKAPNGQASAVSVNGTETAIKTATDMYYEITPTDEGYVVIKNTGNALIAITKLRLTQVGEATTQTLSLRTTRALMMYVASLNETDETIENPFTDVTEDSYYYESVLWAVENGITNGVSSTKFGVGQDCTRAQAVTFLWRANGCPEPETTTTTFTDVSKDSYYYKAVLWAIENGITSGTGKTTFSPDASVTRGQFVTFLHRAEGKPESIIENPFTDVNESSYYYDAVLWAVESGITHGTSADKFNPDAVCTREQIVTFLWRAAN